MWKIHDPGVTGGMSVNRLALLAKTLWMNRYLTLRNRITNLCQALTPMMLDLGQPVDLPYQHS